MAHQEIRRWPMRNKSRGVKGASEVLPQTAGRKGAGRDVGTGVGSAG